jgi:hypothetical protein
MRGLYKAGKVGFMSLMRGDYLRMDLVNELIGVDLDGYRSRRILLGVFLFKGVN